MNKSRAEYFRKRRQTMGQFYAMLDRKLLEKLDVKLKNKNMSRTAWLKDCINRELTEEG